jgi:chemotaxis protein MotB
MIGAQEGDQDTGQHELVIIKRRAGGEEAPHKGGVWKIAHADFMTALMAFFLVMWLITATDEKTITGVANYFNPIRLTDSTARPKGIFAPDAKDGSSDAGKHGEPKTSKAAEAQKKAEAAMFGAPYEVLDKLAAEAGSGAPNLHVTERGNALAHNTGEAFRDPFDPDSRYEPLRHAETDHAPDEKSAGPTLAEPTPPPGAESQAKPEDKSAVPPVSASSSDLKKPIEQAVRDSGFSPIPGIDVRSTAEGVLISISDQPDFEMFGISSAKPKPEVVVLLDKIGKILQSRPENIVIRGHTDARPYRAGDYDNWRLSTSRAQMAYYMLMRSGIPEGRVSRIEGHADHDLQDASNPLAAENRRIEILLAKDKP